MFSLRIREHQTLRMFLVKLIRLPATPVKNQAVTGTCWSFATTSFLESELLRLGKGEFDLSEMHTVRYNYINRIDNNYLREGKGNLTEGSLSHMLINVVKSARNGSGVCVQRNKLQLKKPQP